MPAGAVTESGPTVTATGAALAPVASVATSEYVP